MPEPVTKGWHWCFCRSKRWCRDSLTIAWARLMGLVGILLAILTAPGVHESIVGGLLRPEWVPYYLIAIAVLTELARRRTLSKD